MCRVLNGLKVVKRASAMQVYIRRPSKWLRSRSCAPAILVCWCAPHARHGDVLIVVDNRHGLFSWCIQSRQPVGHVDQRHRRGGNGFADRRKGLRRADRNAVRKRHCGLIAVAFWRGRKLDGGHFTDPFWPRVSLAAGRRRRCGLHPIGA